ncbi:MAG: hypothetical protein RLZ14_1227 [Actinomycetota bacterium]
MPTSTELGAVGELAASRHGAVTRRQAAELGLGRNAITRLVQRGVLCEPVPGVLTIAGCPPTWQQSLVIATLEGGDSRIVIAGTAGRLHGLDGLARHSRTHVTARRGAATVLPAVQLHQTLHHYPPDHVTVIDGIRVTTMARTLCDLARYEPRRYEQAADDFQRRGHSLAWLEHTADGIELAGPWRGLVDDDLQRRRGGGAVNESWFERLLEECLRSPRLPKLHRQYVVRCERGRFVARVDLAIPELRIAVEAHSRRFHTGPRAETSDETRDHRLAEAGWITTYVGWRSVTESPAQVRAMLERTAARRAIDLGIDLRTLVNAQRPTPGR